MNICPQCKKEFDASVYEDLFGPYPGTCAECSDTERTERRRKEWLTSRGIPLHGFAKQGQTHCSDCGAFFVPVQEYSDMGHLSTICPRGCNRGSWWHKEPSEIYCLPVSTE